MSDQRIHGDPQRQAEYYSEEDSFSMAPVIQTLRRYRKVIKTFSIAIGAAVLIGGLILYLAMPSHRTAALRFRLDFDGVDKGEYPNGTKFSSAEIVASPVLSQVYGVNDLRRYITFERFKNSVFVLESNRDLEMLEGEYRAKLSDVKLTPVDRERLEKEFQTKRESLRIGEYTLNLVRDEHIRAIPSSLINKILNDILGTWAENAAERKGALKYNMPVYSRNIIRKEYVEAEDYIVAVDILRTKIDRILLNIDLIAKLPGATIIRTGKQRISLAEVRANLEDIRRFDLDPLIGQVRISGLSKGPRAATLYLESRLAQTQLDQQEAEGRGRTLRDALHQYTQERGAVTTSELRPGAGSGAPLGSGGGATTMIPQLGESFLDRLVDLSTRNSDIEFRQEITGKIINEGLTSVTLEKEVAYYKDVVTAFRGSGGVRVLQSTGSPTAETFKADSEKALNSILESLDQLNAIYEEISVQNLNPRTVLYTVTSPVSTTSQSAVSIASILLYGLLFWVLANVVVVLACLIRSRLSDGSMLPAFFDRSQLPVVSPPPDHSREVATKNTV